MDWGAIATLVVTVLGAAAWVVGAISSLKSELHALVKRVDHHAKNMKSEHDAIWTKLENHGDRLVKLEHDRQ